MAHKMCRALAPGELILPAGCRVPYFFSAEGGASCGNILNATSCECDVTFLFASLAFSVSVPLSTKYASSPGFFPSPRSTVHLQSNAYPRTLSVDKLNLLPSSWALLKNCYR